MAKSKIDNIRGHPGYYISKYGRLYTRHIPGKTDGVLGNKWRRRKLKSLSNGRYVKYLRVEIQGIKYYVHRLVAEAYIPNPDNLPCVGHKDNNPLNNRVSNLYWCTQKENMEQMVSDGRSLKGDKNPSWVDKPLDKIGNMYSSGMGVMEIGRKLNLSKHIVQKSIQIIFKQLWEGRK